MQEKYASKGLVVISVSVDDPDDKEKIDEANSFLRKAKIPLRNFHLTEPDEVWNKKLEFTLPPCYYVFDRRGKWVRFRGQDYKVGVPYGEMDKVILQMLDDR